MQAAAAPSESPRASEGARQPHDEPPEASGHSAPRTTEGQGPQPQPLSLSQPQSALAALDKRLLLRILEKLDALSLCRVGATCRRMRRLYAKDW